MRLFPTTPPGWEDVRLRIISVLLDVDVDVVATDAGINGDNMDDGIVKRRDDVADVVSLDVTAGTKGDNFFRGVDDELPGGVLWGDVVGDDLRLSTPRRNVASKLRLSNDLFELLIRWKMELDVDGFNDIPVRTIVVVDNEWLDAEEAAAAAVVVVLVVVWWVVLVPEELPPPLRLRNDL